MKERETDRLACLSPRLAERIRSSRPEAARRAALAAAEFAVSRSGMDDKALLAAMESLRTGDALSPSAREAAEAALAELDDAYFSSRERGDPDAHWDGLFRSARAANAVLSALDPEPHDAACDASYEANAATDDLAGVETTVFRALRGNR